MPGFQSWIDGCSYFGFGELLWQHWVGLGGNLGLHQLGTTTWKWTFLISAAGFQQLLLLLNQLEPPGPLAPFLQGANAIPQLRFRNLPHHIRNRSCLWQGQGSRGWGPSSGASAGCLVALEAEALGWGSRLPVILSISTVLVLTDQELPPKPPRFPFQRVSQVRMWRAG